MKETGAAFLLGFAAAVASIVRLHNEPTVARDVCALMEYGGYSLADAANKVVHETLVNMGGDGGIISVDKDGNIALTFNTSGMYRGYVRAGEKAVVEIYQD